MNLITSSKLIPLGLMMALAAGGCTYLDSGSNATPTPPPAATATPVPSPSPMPEVTRLPVTLPLIDALFHQDERFTAELKSRLALTDDQINQLRQLAREETGKLREVANGEYEGTTAGAVELAREKVTAVIGEEKTRQLAILVQEFWADDRTARIEGGGSELPTPPSNVPLAGATPGGTPIAGPVGTASPSSTPPGVASRSLPTAPNSVPADSRIVVNAPAYRMDVFEGGQLVKSYRIGIGYPEFPLPQGLRHARSIIFNPTWTPPDEPWVESSRTVEVGKTVPAGDRLNPLGPIKIPIGLPSLIHGGKQPAKLGTFASHGCVGLTNAQVQDFAQVLASLGGVEIGAADIKRYAQTRTKTQTVKLKNEVPVELRYETIVVTDGKLHIYRDVYDLDTNTEANLATVLSAHGVTMDQLTPTEREAVTNALREMSRDPAGKATEKTAAEKKAEQERNIKRGQVTRSVRGKKEVVIEIAALADKGYPAPVALSTGSASAPPKAKK